MPTPTHRLRNPWYTQRRFLFGLCLLPILFLSPPTSSQSQTVDPHALFEDRCSRCHGHAGAFAREKLAIENGEVVGRRSKRRVLDTLPRHFGRLTDEEAHLVENMFHRQIEAGGLYARKCRICHDPAKDLARQTLTLRDGRLIGRYSRRLTEDFLSFHGRLQDDERNVLLDMLAWQLATDSTEMKPD